MNKPGRPLREYYDNDWDFQEDMAIWEGGPKLFIPSKPTGRTFRYTLLDSIPLIEFWETLVSGAWVLGAKPDLVSGDYVIYVYPEDTIEMQYEVEWDEPHREGMPLESNRLILLDFEELASDDTKAWYAAQTKIENPGGSIQVWGTGGDMDEIEGVKDIFNNPENYKLKDDGDREQ